MAKVTVADRQEQGAAYDSIVAALRHLAAACDGAVTVDMVGFNGFDTHFGKELAERSYTGQLTAKQVTAARKMLHKYSGQLAGAGITLPDVAEVESWVVGKEKAQAAAAV